MLSRNGREKTKRIRKDLKEIAKDPIEASHNIVKQIQKEEKMQQAIFVQTSLLMP